MKKEQEVELDKLKTYLEYAKKDNLDKFILDVKTAETVLSMLKEKDKEIEKLKADNKKAWKLNANMTQRHLSDIFKIKKKDKQIDLMAKAMDKIQDPQVCKYCDNNINSNHGYCVDAGKCKEGIKQYFERKVRDER